MFRFNKETEALGKLDAAIPMVTGIVDSRVSREQREELLSRIRKLRDCLDRTSMPKLARLTIRPVLYHDRSRRLADVEIRVEGITVALVSPSFMRSNLAIPWETSFETSPIRSTSLTAGLSRVTGERC